MKWNEYSAPGSKTGAGYQNTFDVKPKGTSLSVSERTRLQSIGKELRTARGHNRSRLINELEQMTEGKDFTASDSRLVAAYAKAGAMQEQDGYAANDGQRLLDMVRDINE